MARLEVAALLWAQRPVSTLGLVGLSAWCVKFSTQSNLTIHVLYYSLQEISLKEDKLQQAVKDISTPLETLST